MKRFSSKKWLSLVLTFAFILSAMVIPVRANEDEEDDIVYTAGLKASFFSLGAAGTQIAKQNSLFPEIRHNMLIDGKKALPISNPATLLNGSDLVSFLSQNTGVSNATQNVAVKFYGFLDITVAGDYSFKMTGDDGFRFEIDGDTAINFWYASSTENSIESDYYSFDVGRYPITISLAQGSSTSKLNLEWNIDDGDFSTIPASSYYCTDWVDLEEIELDETELELEIGSEEILSPYITPEDATDQSVIWTSSNSQIVSVDIYGVVTAVGSGSATISAETVDGGKTVSCLVTTTGTVVDVTGVELDVDEIELEVGDEDFLIATVLPENASNQNVTWTSSNSSVAIVDNDGYIRAVGAGTATITVKTVNGGKTAKCKIIVTPPYVDVEGVSLNITKLDLEVFETKQLTAKVFPTNATDKGVEWDSSKPKVATVTRKGLVKAKSNGTTVISVMTDDGGYEKKCRVTVTTPVKSVTIKKGATVVSKKKLTYSKKLKSVKLTAALNPKTASVKTVTWKTSKPKVAKVNAKGKVTFLKKGKAKITVITKDGNKKSFVTIKIT